MPYSYASAFSAFYIEILTLLQILFEYRKNEIRHVLLLPSLYHIIFNFTPSASAGILCKISNITISIKAVIQVKHKIQLSMSIILLCNLIYVHPQFRWFIVVLHFMHTYVIKTSYHFLISIILLSCTYATILLNETI